MSIGQPLDIEIYRESIEIQRIGSRAISIAQDESRMLGVPNVYSHNGTVYYETPNGELTSVDPYVNANS